MAADVHCENQVISSQQSIAKCNEINLEGSHKETRASGRVMARQCATYFHERHLDQVLEQGQA